jgi:KDO2-lipid IV(A) lauroyltransferase
MARARDPRADAAVGHGVRALLAGMSLLPWQARLDVAGRLGRLALAASPKLRRRIHANLAHVMPDLDAAARRQLVRAVGDCFGRTALELFQSEAFERAANWSPPEGPGREAVEAALAQRRGLLVVSGHFGGWEAIRHWFRLAGAPCATVYRRLDNPRLDALYRASVERTGGPALPRGRGVARRLLRHLAEGGVVALLVDQYQASAPRLDFLGRPAPTTVIPAALALRSGAALVPAFAPRSRDGRRIAIHFAPPVPPSTPEAMMQTVNDALAAQVRAHPGQYYWLHRRWSKRLPDPPD